MQQTDIPVIEAAYSWLEQNKHIWICTILSTYGSAPRGIGAVFVTDGKNRAGSISGGCLEDEFIGLIAQGRFKRPCEIFIYGEHASDLNIKRELPCGGTIRLLVEYFTPSENYKEHCHLWLKHAYQKQCFTRIISFPHDNKTIAPVLKYLNDSQSQFKQGVVESTQQITLTYTKPYLLLLIGIGPVAEHIARLGLMAGFQVRICDIRRDLADSWTFNLSQGGIEIDWMSPDLFVEKYADNQTALLALAHDPRLDDAALMAVFDTSAFYIGAMGSHRTSKNRRERLQRICEISEDQLKKLHAPIGLNIGSKTPMEIAISTIADIIRVKNSINVNYPATKDHWVFSLGVR